MTIAANVRQAKEARREDREQKVRELAAGAYVAAMEAIQWLSIMRVEDSVDPRFADDYVPKTEHAVARLREARAAITRVAALGGDEVSRVAEDVAVALNVLDDAWHGAQDYRRRILAHGGGHPRIHRSLLNVNSIAIMSASQSSRKALSGFDGGELPYKEIDQGNVLEGSLLFALRQITAGSTNHPRRS